MVLAGENCGENASGYLPDGARRSLVSVGVLGHSGSLLALLINILASDNNLGPEDHHYTGLSPLTYKQSHIPHSFAHISIPNPLPDTESLPNIPPLTGESQGGTIIALAIPYTADTSCKPWAMTPKV